MPPLRQPKPLSDHGKNDQTRTKYLYFNEDKKFELALSVSDKSLLYFVYLNVKRK